MATTSTSDLLVITCASGQQCSYIIPRLYPHYNLRLIVHAASSASRLQTQYPRAEVLQADLTEPSQCHDILRGATRVFHIGPSLHPHEAQIGINMIDAAVLEARQAPPGANPNGPSDGGSSGGGNPNGTTKAGFKHFIYSSVLNTQFRKMFNHDRKRYVEEYLFESPLNYTVLNPGDFLNGAFPIRRFQSMIREGGKAEYRGLMGLESKSAFLVLEDYAEAVRKILDEGEKHYAAQYQMVSMKPVAYGVVARDMGRVLRKVLPHGQRGEEFPVSTMGLEEAVDFLCQRLFGRGVEKCEPRERDGAERLILFYRRRGLQGNPNALEWILGRKPTSHVEWFERQLQLEA